jgi:hypothetical protein
MSGTEIFKVVRLTGIEPVTHCLEGSCSIQLSYRRKEKNKIGNRAGEISFYQTCLIFGRGGEI